MNYEEFKQKPIKQHVKEFLVHITICGGVFIAFGFVNRVVFDGGLLISKKTRDEVKVFLQESQGIFGKEVNYQILDSSKNSTGKVYVNFDYPYDLDYFSQYYKDKLLEIGFKEKKGANPYLYCRMKQSLIVSKYISSSSHIPTLLMTWRSPDVDCE